MVPACVSAWRVGRRPPGCVLQGYQGMVPNGSPARRTVSEDPAQLDGHSPAPLAEQKVRLLDVGIPLLMWKISGKPLHLVQTFMLSSTSG